MGKNAGEDEQAGLELPGDWGQSGIIRQSGGDGSQLPFYYFFNSCLWQVLQFVMRPVKNLCNLGKKGEEAKKKKLIFPMGKPKYGRFRQKLVWKMLYFLLFSQGHEKKNAKQFF